MKPAIILLLSGLAAISASAAANKRPRPIQAFTAVFWTETTLHSPRGKVFVFMQRIVYTRDYSGKTSKSVYRPTKGLQHDTTAPLERVLTGSSSAQLPMFTVVGHETSSAPEDLGTAVFSGMPATGHRQVLSDSTSQHTHIYESWFSAPLGLTVRVDDRNDHGDTIVSNLSELRLGNPDPPPAVAPSATPAFTMAILYRALFTHIAHMERDRKATDPTFHVNMEEIEAHLAKKMSVSANEWQQLVDTSLRVDRDTQKTSEEVRNLAFQHHATGEVKPVLQSALATQQASRQALKSGFDNRVATEIDRLRSGVGPDATARIETYLRETLANSISTMPSTSPSKLTLRQTGGR